jgi:hypothetical protein
LFQAIEEVSEEGKGLGTVWGEYADPERRFSDVDMTEAVQDFNRGAGMCERELAKNVADKSLSHGMVGFVKEGGDGLVPLLTPNNPRKSYDGARSGIGNLGQGCDGIGRESDEDLHLTPRDWWDKGDLVVGMKGFSELKEVTIFAESAGRLEMEKGRVSMDEEVPELFCCKRFGGVKSFFGQPDGEAGLGEIKNSHGSAS